jgi:hypothetical protein
MVLQAVEASHPVNAPAQFAAATVFYRTIEKPRSRNFPKQHYSSA